MKILMAGDLVGAPGRRALLHVAGRMKKTGEVDFVVANAENAAGGKGLNGVLAEELFAGGADVLTMGDHTWDQREIQAYLKTVDKVIRPANFAPGCPGNGIVTIHARLCDVTVISLIGRTFMNPHDCPYRTVDALLQKTTGLGRVILVDMHAEATSEKVVMGRYLDGRVSAVAGTHTHVQTSDEAILPKGTAYITDLGMTGAKDSAIGRDLESVTAMLLTGMPVRWKVARKNVMLEGVVIDVDEKTGKARGIRRIRESGGADEAEQD